MSKHRTSRRGLEILLIALIALAVVQAACDESLFNASHVVEESVSGDWIRVYFTDPRYPDEEIYRTGGLDETLATVIGMAEQRIDMAAYDLDLATVTDALIRAQNAGLQVRVVIESENADEEAIDRLRQRGVRVIEDERTSGLMHNKFVIIDEQWVWTGSWNFTENGTYRNNNHAVLIASAAVAANYAAEFEEMVEGAFGPTSPAETRNPQVEIISETEAGEEQRATVETYFAPEDDVADQIIAEIDAADERLRFMAFTFTNEEIAEAIVARSNAGVTVQGVIEARNAERTYSQYDRLRRAAHDILQDGNPYIMHHKAMIIDEETVILGSFNFTASADRTNDENVLVIHDPEVAALFVAEFGRVYERARSDQ